MTYPVPDPDLQPVSMRVLVASTQLDLASSLLGTLLRHEITHVAVGARNDEAPVWLREGLADHVGHRQQRRRLGEVVRSLMPEGGVTQMPPDGLFHTSDWGPSYLLAWYSVLWLTLQSSPEAPWDLLTTLEQDPGDFHHESACSAVSTA